MTSSLTSTVLSITSVAHLTVTGVRVVSIVEMGGCGEGGGGHMALLTITVLSITSEAHLTVTGVRVVWIVEIRTVPIVLGTFSALFRVWSTILLFQQS